jgi:diguanylate cyclase (GGDEF)-like protein
MITVLRHWWGRPDHYDLVSDYLATHHLRSFARLATALYFAAMAALSVLVLSSPMAPTEPWLRTVLIGFGCCWLVGAAIWWVHWPTRRQSLLFVGFADIGIAYNCLAVTDPRAGLIGCIGFAAAAGFVAFFHLSVYLAITLGIGLGTAGLCAYQYAMSGDPIGAAWALIGIISAMLSVAITVKISVQVLGDLAIDSDTDELTGLLNRRGFSRATVELAGLAPSDGVGVIMVDIDRFKIVNDTQGHAAGDRLLITVGEILAKAASTHRAAVARYGGEEFVIAAALGPDALHNLAEMVRANIEALPDGVTVSVGIADAHKPAANTGGDLLRHLVDGADQAMYLAKHAGGNRLVRHIHRTG